jgi:hypothetical protein
MNDDDLAWGKRLAGAAEDILDSPSRDLRASSRDGAE